MAGEPWRQTRLGDIVSIKHGWPFKSELFDEELTGRPIVVAVGNFQYTGGFRFESTATKEYRGDYPSEYELEAGDVLLVMTCQTPGGEILGVPARIPNDGRKYLHNQRLGKVVVKRPDQVDVNYLYWMFLSRPFNRELCASATGTKIVHTAPSRIEAYTFELPPLREQRAIASILGTLDDKIQLNRRKSRTLEGMARAIFKSWFVDFDPVRAKAAGKPPPGLKPALANLFPDRFEDSELGEIPKGWRVQSIYEAASVVYGAPFASKQFNAEERGKPLIRIRDLADESPGVWTDEVHAKGYLVKPGDVVVGMDGEFRPHLWGGVEAWLNQRVCVFQPKSLYSAAFVLNAIVGPLMEVESTETATTVIHLGKADIDRFKVVAPLEAILQTFNAVAHPLYDRIVAEKQQSRTLTALRDALLPKLISGELRVPCADRIVGRAV